MRILFEVNHPAHVHFFKNVIRILENEGHDIKIVAKDKDITLDLLKAYNLKYEVFGKNYFNIIKKMYGVLIADYRLLKIARGFKPDILVGRGSIYMAHLSILIRKPYIAFVDTDNANLIAKFALPFASVICSPACFKMNLDPKKHIRFNGYKELAYLHPNYFTLDPSILHELGFKDDEKIIIIRTVAWGASHDIGDKGFTNLKDVVNSLEPYGRILITSEIQLPLDLNKYGLKLSPERIHHLLNFATLYIGESATMATESAILGTPAIFISTSRRGYTDELGLKYDMLYTFSDIHNRQKFAVDKAIELLKDKNIKQKWQQKREKLLTEKIDVTKFMSEVIENYTRQI
ncbi:MAG: DUF354 domain-containing protein [Candidatus Methanoperedens sp.]|nr:DUF354 domain-containing protein [Candidatus Methanoperedens sp.]